MSCPTITLRSALFAAIVAQRDGAGYAALNDIDVVETQLPSVSLPELRTRARVTVLGTGGDEERISRAGLYEIQQPVQINLQQSVKPTDAASIDALLNLLYELAGTARTLALPGYRWDRTDALKDQNGTPYDFVRLQADHVFEAVIMPRYHHTSADEE